MKRVHHKQRHSCTSMKDSSREQLWSADIGDVWCMEAGLLVGDLKRSSRLVLYVEGLEYHAKKNGFYIVGNKKTSKALK